MGQKQNQPFQLLFNTSLKVDFRGSRVTSNGGLILVRELDERLGLEKLIEEHLSDSRQGLISSSRWPIYCASRVTTAWRAKRTSMTPNDWQPTRPSDWDELLSPEIDRQQAEGKQVAFRAGAAFAKPEIYEALEERGVMYAIRIPANDSLERDNCGVADAARGEAEPQASRSVQGLSLPSGQLEDSTTSSGEGGVPRRRVVSASWLHRHEPEPARSGGDTVL
jgi:hypothetical protein